MNKLGRTIADVIAVLLVLILLFGIGSHAWTADNPEKPLPWSDSLRSFEKAAYQMVDDIAQSAVRAFGQLTRNLESFSEWCGNPGECVNKVINTVQAYGATFLLTVYTWVGVHFIEKLPR